MSLCPPRIRPQLINGNRQGYSNGLSEEVLGRAIKKHDLPRNEIVVMTKLFLAVSKTDTSEATLRIPDLDAAGYVNQYGLSRKVNISCHFRGMANSLLTHVPVVHF
jgi:hypothetical protein